MTNGRNTSLRPPAPPCPRKHRWTGTKEVHLYGCMEWCLWNAVDGKALSGDLVPISTKNKCTVEVTL